MKVKNDFMQQSKHNEDSESEPDAVYEHSASRKQKHKGLNN